jgi:hypothetical protein
LPASVGNHIGSLEGQTVIFVSKHQVPHAAVLLPRNSKPLANGFAPFRIFVLNQIQRKQVPSTTAIDYGRRSKDVQRIRASNVDTDHHRLELRPRLPSLMESPWNRMRVPGRKMLMGSTAPSAGESAIPQTRRSRKDEGTVFHAANEPSMAV